MSANKINRYSQPIVTSSTLFHVKKVTMNPDAQTSPSGFCSPAEAAAFWKNINSTPFPSKLRQQGSSLDTLVNKVGPLKSDVSDIVLTVMFSDVFTTTHQTMFGPNAHPVLRKRSTQPIVNATFSKDNEAKPKTNTSKPIHGTKATIAALVSNKVLPKSTNPVFKEMFPATDLPHVNLVNGLPKVNKAIFNSLLISKLRAAKSCLKLKSTERLEADVVKHVSRLIDKSIISALNDKKNKKDMKPATAKATTSKPASKPAKKQKRRTVEFVTASAPDTTTPEVKPQPKADPPAPKPTSTLSTTDLSLSLIDEARVRSLVEKTTFNSLTDRELESLRSLDPDQANAHLYVPIEHYEHVISRLAPSVLIQCVRFANPGHSENFPRTTDLVNGFLCPPTSEYDNSPKSKLKKLAVHLQRPNYLAEILSYYETHPTSDS